MKADEKQQILETDSLIAKLQAVADRAQPRDRAARAQGQDRVGGAAGDDRRAAAVLPAPAAEGHPGRARRRREARGAGTARAASPRRNLPEPVAAVATREVDRLERMTPASPEYQMIRTYIDWVLDVPWSTITEDRLDPIAAREVLDEDHYDLDKVKERIVEYLAVQKLKAQQTGALSLKGPILCFVGPPGVGKTSLGQSIARAMNRKFVRISLGGVRDEAEIRGHRRTYIGAIPGRIVQALKQAGAMNPVFMLDEIDKISAGLPGRSGGRAARGARSGAEPFVPRSLPRDQRRSVAVLFIATSNQLGTIHPGAARSHGDHLARRLQRGGEAAHRAALPDPAAARRARARARRSVDVRGRRGPPDHRRVHARGRGAESRAADRRGRPEDRGARRRPPRNAAGRRQ